MLEQEGGVNKKLRNCNFVATAKGRLGLLVVAECSCSDDGRGKLWWRAVFTAEI